MNKRQLYETIMRKISLQVKHALNESNIAPVDNILDYFHDTYLSDEFTIIPEIDNELETIENEYVTILSIDYKDGSYVFTYENEYGETGIIENISYFNDDHEIIQMFISYIADNMNVDKTRLQRFVDRAYEEYL